MDSLFIRCSDRTESLLLLTVLVLAMVFLHTSALTQTCMPVVTNTVNPFDNSTHPFNGIVVGTAVVGGGLPSGCSASPGWQGVVSQPFTVFGASGGITDARIFLAGYNATADGTLNKIYLGVHVEGDPDVRREDRLVLYFDANGNGGSSWDAEDFALLYEIGPKTQPSNEVCNQDFNVGDNNGTLQFYRFENGYWVPKVVPAGITSKASWDYDATNDGETGVWELEMGINVANLSVSAPSSGSGFRVGAKLYIDQVGAQNSTVWRWPTALTSESNALLFDPNEGGVTPTNLERPSVGNCADVIFDPEATSGVTATDANGNSNAFTRLEAGDFSGQTPTKRNHFTAKVKFFNPSNLSDNSAVAVPNVGRVQFYIKPWNGSFLGEYPMGQPLISFKALNTSQTVSLDWPGTKNEYDNPTTHQPMNDLASSTHSCLKVQLDGFTANLNVASDVCDRNLTYITASTVHDTFLISAKGVEPTLGKDVVDYLLRVSWENIQSAKTAALTGSTELPEIIVEKVCWPWQKQRPKTWSYRFTNATNIGLQDRGKGYFLLPMRPNEEKRVAIELTGGTMPVAPNQFQLSPRAGGGLLTPPSGEPPLGLSVQAGKMVTIIAHGLVNVDPTNDRNRSNGPNGFSDSIWSRAKFLLPSGYYSPSENIGALIGSFDDFRTAFVVGADITFLVPQGATKLSLAVNDIVGAYDKNTGKGFELNVIITDPLYLPTRLAAPGDPNLGLPARARAGSNLPNFNIDVYQAIDVSTPKRTKYLRPTGYVAYGIYDSHPEIEPPICCGPVAGMSLVGSSLLTLFGLALLWYRAKQKTTRE